MPVALEVSVDTTLLAHTHSAPGEGVALEVPRVTTCSPSLCCGTLGYVPERIDPALQFFFCLLLNVLPVASLLMKALFVVYWRYVTVALVQCHARGLVFCVFCNNQDTTRQ